MEDTYICEYCRKKYNARNKINHQIQCKQKLRKRDYNAFKIISSFLIDLTPKNVINNRINNASQETKNNNTRSKSEFNIFNPNNMEINNINNIAEDRVLIKKESNYFEHLFLNNNNRNNRNKRNNRNNINININNHFKTEENIYTIFDNNNVNKHNLDYNRKPIIQRMNNFKNSPKKNNNDDFLNKIKEEQKRIKLKKEEE